MTIMKPRNAFNSSTFVSHVVSLLAAVRHCAAYLLVSRTIRESSKKEENITSGSRLAGTRGPTLATHGVTSTGEGVVVQPIVHVHVYTYVIVYKKSKQFALYVHVCFVHVQVNMYMYMYALYTYYVM